MTLTASLERALVDRWHPGHCEACGERCASDPDFCPDCLRLMREAREEDTPNND